MWNKKIKILFILLFAAAALFFFIAHSRKVGTPQGQVQEIKPHRGAIDLAISTTGTILPKNRLEIKPPVNGRIEEILVREGELVKTGQTLAWMSSTERAALIDAARGKGEEALKYWKEAYKPIPLISPINAEVIVATTQPGQTVTTADAVVVLSDELIARAQVDETDIGRIAVGQDAVIVLDAYADTQIKGKVEHIYYESETVNNVTVYKVDVIPVEVPPFFRSGMNSTVDFTVGGKENILLVPVGAVHKDKDEDYVLLKQKDSSVPLKRRVKLGITDDKNYEILSGITADDVLLMTTEEYVFSESSDSAGSNPFLPKMPGGKKPSAIAK